MISIDDLQKISKFGLDESAHYYRCIWSSDSADDQAFNRGAMYGTRRMVEQIYILIMREKKAEGSKYDCDKGRICPKCGKVMLLCEDEKKNYNQYWKCDCGYKEDD